MNNNPQGNNQNKKQNQQSQNFVVEKSANFFRLTTKQVASKINDLETIISTNHSSLAPHQNDPSLGSSTTNAFFRKRLNSTDLTILENSAYKALDNKDLILETRIENLETELSKVVEKLEVAKTIQNDVECSELSKQKQTIENDIKNLKNSYKKNDLESILTKLLVRILTLPKEIKNEIKIFIKNTLRQSKFTKKIKPLFRALMIRDTLNKLNKINNSIDELVKMQVPLGENEAKYATLVNHLVQAGTLHSQIKKELKS